MEDELDGGLGLYPEGRRVPGKSIHSPPGGVHFPFGN